MHVTRLTVKRLVLQAGRWFGGWSQFAFDSRPGERLNGAHAGPGLEHRLVLCTCRFEQEAARSGSAWRKGELRSSRLASVFQCEKVDFSKFSSNPDQSRESCKSHSGKSYAFHLICVWLEWRFELGIKNGSSDVVQLNYIVLFFCLSLRMTPALFYIWQADLEKSGSCPNR